MSRLQFHLFLAALYLARANKRVARGRRLIEGGKK